MDKTSGKNALETELGISYGIEEEHAEEKGRKKVPFYKLFSFADSRDKILMTIGTIAAIINGLSLPLMALMLGNLIDVFGTAGRSDTTSLVSLEFVYLALGIGAAAFLQRSCWMITGVRQSARIRSLYLKTTLQQDMTDEEVSTEEVMGRMNDDTILIQDAVGDKMGKFVQGAASFLGGFTVAIIKGWLLTLVLLTSIILGVIFVWVTPFIIFKIYPEAQNELIDAANVVHRTVDNIRTVASFTREKQVVANYNKLLATIYKSEIIVGLNTGLFTGLILFTMSCYYALTVWFGAKLVLQKVYTGGDVFTVPLALGISFFSLALACGLMRAFSTGQAAAFRMFDTIYRNAFDPKGNKLNDICGDIEFRDVCVSYPARPNERTIDEFSPLIPSGTTATSVGQKIVEKGTPFVLKDTHDVEQNIDNKDMPDISESPRIGTTFQKTALDNENDFSHEASKDLPRVSICRLAHLNKPEALVLIVGAIFCSIAGAIIPIYGLLISFAIEIFYELPHALKKNSEFWALMFFCLGVVSLIAYMLTEHLFNVAGNKLIERIRLMCFEKVVNMEIGWFDMPKNSSCTISTRLSIDATQIRSLVGDALALFVHEMTLVLVALVISLQACWQLALITVALMHVIAFNAYSQSKTTKGPGEDVKLIYEKANQIANDVVSYIRTVGSGCDQERILDMYKKICKRAAIYEIREGFISGVGFGLSMCSAYLILAATFYVGARLVEDGKTTFPHVLRAFWALFLVAKAMFTMRAVIQDSSKAKSAAALVFAILDRKSKIDPNDETGLTLEDVNGEIKIMNVNFSYPTRPGAQVLTDLSFTIQSGKIIALVGESGSGKSTVISLVQRFYDPDSGHITLDGIEIHKFQVKWLRQQMGWVSQEPVLFDDTIRANIASGKGGNATEAEIIAAAKSANAHDFISGLHQGYDTMVGECGVELSGGQKQRVAIARAIVNSPKILLIDEATSALDTESEKMIQEALGRVMLNRTTVVISHRLSTVRKADVIATFENGRIAENAKWGITAL